MKKVLVITIPNFQTAAMETKVKVADIVMPDMDKEIMIRGNVKAPDFIAADAAEIKITHLCVREMAEILLIRAVISNPVLPSAGMGLQPISHFHVLN